MRNTTKDRKRFWHSGNFKTILFVFLIATIIKLTLDNLGHSEWYCKLIRKQFTQLQTTLIYYGILAVSVFFYLKVRLGKYKWFHIFVLSSVPLSIYLALFYFKNKYLYGAIIFFFVVDIAMDFWLFVSCSLDAKLLHMKEELIRLRREFLWDLARSLGSISIYAGGICTYLLLISVWGVGLDVFKEITYATNVRDLMSTVGESLWETNKESLKLLSGENYSQLNNQERLNALQELINIECEYLGVEPCQLKMEELEESVAAQYGEMDRSISISPKYVEANVSIYAIEVLLHEMYHCYQYDCVRNYERMLAAGLQPDMELKYYRDCAQWLKEIENYYDCKDVSYFDDYYRYASQSIEITADQYSNEWAEYYWEYINSIGKDEMTPEEVLERVS